MNAQLHRTDPQVQLVEDIARFELDPLGYARYNFPWGMPGGPLEGKRLRTWQVKALDIIGKKLRAGTIPNDLGHVFSEVVRIARASGHGIGKSALVAIIIMWAMDTREDTRGVVTANTEKQLQTKTWPEVTKWHNMALTRHWSTITATALYSNCPGHDKTWRFDAVPWSDTNTEAFAGLHNEGKRLVLVFDEASAIADKVWEVAEGALTDLDTQIIWLVFGNATRATGRFRECFRKHRKDWDVDQIDSRTVEGVNLVELARFVEANGGEDSDTVKVRIRGVFPVLSAYQFFSETDIDAAFDRHLRPDQYNFAPKILTCDPSWTGEDELVISMRQGLHFRVIQTLPKNDNDIQVAAILGQLEDTLQADAVFVDFGYGTGIVSAGQTWGRDWRLVNFADGANDPGYANKRAEMYGEARKWMKEGGSLGPDLVLRDECLGIQTVARLDGKVQLESKKEMKKRGLPSPNRLDSLVISFAYPVAVRPRHLDGTPLHLRDPDTREPGAVYNPLG